MTVSWVRLWKVWRWSAIGGGSRARRPKRRLGEQTLRAVPWLLLLLLWLCQGLAATPVSAAGTRKSVKPGAAATRAALKTRPPARGPGLSGSERPSGTRVFPGPGGVRVMVALRPDAVDLMDARALNRRPSRILPQAPVFTPETIPGLPFGAREYIIALYDADGHLKKTLAIPGNSLHFYDEVVAGSQSGELRTRALTPRADIRTIDIPPVEGLAFIGVFFAAKERTRGPASGGPSAECVVVVPPLPATPSKIAPSVDVPHRRIRKGSRGPEGGHPVGPPSPPSPVPPKPPAAGVDSISLVRLGIYDVRRPPGKHPEPSLPTLPPWLEPPISFFGKIPFGHSECNWPLTQVICPGPQGALIDTRTLLDSGPSNQKFDIVIMGDGFTDITKFDTFAQRYMDAMLAIEPFATLSQQNKINIRTIRTISTDSGVSKCPDRVSRNTYYHVSGRWIDPYGVEGPAGYFGVGDWCTVLDRVDAVVPLDTVELMVMIANCDLYGGDADPDNLIAYLPAASGNLPPDGVLPAFEALAPHESAHVIGELLEEYAACLTEDTTRAHPNIEKSPDHLDAWWKDLADPDELDDSRNFLTIHTCDDDLDKTGCYGNGGCCKPVVESPGSVDMLGAFWGAQYGDAGGTARPECDPYCDEMGSQMPMSCDWYRPQATCRMRNLRSEFCRACKKILTDRVTQSAP